MNIRHQTLADPEDMFNDTRMSFGEHLEELRGHMFRAIYGLVIGILIALPLGKYVLNLIAMPVQNQLMVYWERYYNRKIDEIVERMKREGAGDKIDLMPVYKLDLNKVADRWKLPHLEEENRWEELRPDPEQFLRAAAKLSLEMKPPMFSTLSVQEAFTVWIMVCFVTGLVLASPWVFYQLWSFVAAGLYPQEKRLVNVYLPYSIGLFLAGVALSEIFAIPNAVSFLLWFNEWLGLQPDMRLSEWLWFAIMVPVVFGVLFQLPIVMLFSAKIGVTDSKFFRSKRRIALFIVALLAGVLNPAPDLVSTLLLCLALWMLYELGVWLCVWHERNEKSESKTPDSGELIEV